MDERLHSKDVCTICNDVIEHSPIEDDGGNLAHAECA